MYKCPKCGSTNLRVDVSIICTLTQDDDNFEVEPTKGAEWCWDNESLMWCANDEVDCSYVGPSQEFYVE